MARPPASLALLLLSLLLVATAAGAAERRGGIDILASGAGIELVDPATGDARRLTTNGTGPAYVPSRNAFVYVRAGGCAGDGTGACFTEYSVFVKSLANRSPADPGRRVFGWREFFVRKVDVSRGGRMVFSAKPGPGPAGDRLDIYSSDLTGDRVRRLTRSPAFENDPAVSPDGRRVAFIRRVGGRGQIFLMGIDGSGQRQPPTTAVATASPPGPPTAAGWYSSRRESPGLKDPPAETSAPSPPPEWSASSPNSGATTSCFRHFHPTATGSPSSATTASG